MLPRFIILFTLLSLGILGCNKIGGGDVSLVKDGMLEFDKSLTVGKAIDNYKFFKKTDWKSITTDNGRKIVTVVAAIDTDKHPAINKEAGIKSAEMKFEFTVNQDKTFEIGWCGLGFEKNDGEKHTPPENVNLYMCINSLKAIYNNNPEF
ncbi:MAG: hypothetical protein AB7U43_07695 [Desulfobacter sp.]